MGIIVYSDDASWAASESSVFKYVPWFQMVKVRGEGMEKYRHPVSATLLRSCVEKRK